MRKKAWSSNGTVMSSLVSIEGCDSTEFVLLHARLLRWAGLFLIADFEEGCLGADKRGSGARVLSAAL